MPDTIKDGTGKGYLAKVDSTNRIYARAVSETEESAANVAGRAYNLNTGEITLTDAVNTPVIYLKNNEEKDLHVTAIAAGLGTSTGGDATEPVRITVIRNPTAGTIISSPTDIDINANRNYGSTDTLTVDAYKGATGDTMTDGTDHIFFFQPDFGRLYATIDEIIPKGATIGIKIQPPTSNTSLPCYAALICHLQENGS